MERIDSPKALKELIGTRLARSPGGFKAFFAMDVPLPDERARKLEDKGWLILREWISLPIVRLDVFRGRRGDIHWDNGVFRIQVGRGIGTLDWRETWGAAVADIRTGTKPLSSDYSPSARLRDEIARANEAMAERRARREREREAERRSMGRPPRPEPGRATRITGLPFLGFYSRESAWRPLSTRAAGGPRSVGDRISLRGFGRMRFEIVGVAEFEGETCYKVKPMDTVYGIPAGMVEEERRSEPLEEKPPLSKRADEPGKPVASLEEERAKREIRRIREENLRQIREMGLDRPPEYPEGARFFGELFLPGDLVVTRGEPGKAWSILDRQDNKRLGVAYVVRSMEEKLIWAQDVVRGTKGGHLLELPRSEWDVPGKGLPPTGPKAPDPEEEVAMRRWDKLRPLAERLVGRLRPLAAPAEDPGSEDRGARDAQEAMRDLEWHLGNGYKDTLSPERLADSVRQAWWVLKGVPFQTGHARHEMAKRRREIEEENKRRLAQLAPWERAEEERNRQRWFGMRPLAEKLVKRLEPLAEGQEFHEHPRRELDYLRQQLGQGYVARLVHQFESAIREAWWALKGVPIQEGWRRLEERAKGRRK